MIAMKVKNEHHILLGDGGRGSGKKNMKKREHVYKQCKCFPVLPESNQEQVTRTF